MRLGVLLLLLLPLSFAAGEYAIVPVAAMFTVFIIALSHMLSQPLHNPQLEAWAKNEWKELIIAALTVGLVYSAVSIYGNTILGLTTGYPDSTSLMSGVETSFTGFQSSLMNDYADTIRVAQRLGMLTSYSYSMSGGFIMYFAQVNGPYVGISGLMQSLSVLASNISTGILVYEAMILFMHFLFNVSIQAILPIGFALRFIPFTRKIGGTLLGLAIAGIFAYPFAMALTAGIHDNVNVQHSLITADDLEKLSLHLPSFLTSLCTNDFIRIFTSLSEWGWWAIICSVFCLSHLAAYWACFAPIVGTCWVGISYNFYQATQMALMLASSSAMVAASQGMQNAIGANAGVIHDIVMNHLIIPVSSASALPTMEAVFVGGITILVARSLSGALGGELAIAGLERLI
ncbi:MAG: hypothetical protein PHS02_01265 [Candidatus ainarchaeum sp.]|nr:hypothetical protein [Candidatus ainarchaeum sp.]